ncbi:hypothetical protein SS50377_28429 [Spironucleus salmonicida]|uniref:Uncharacterized protein n=1 Tax=Spironucleus salmonicida TaxID=348837 RepID=A0A9P8RUB7_9EUKA|nr:hypothetical protein SS50377_28429 [Spironucleus salmonicida]
MPLISKDYILLKRRQQSKSNQQNVSHNLILLPYIPQPILKQKIQKSESRLEMLAVPVDHPIFLLLKDMKITLRKMRYSVDNFLNMLEDIESALEERVMESEFMKGWQ